MMDGLQKILRYEGVAGLFRGAGARVAFHVPSTAITISSFEQLKLLYEDLLQEE